MLFQVMRMIKFLGGIWVMRKNQRGMVFNEFNTQCAVLPSSNLNNVIVLLEI